MKPLSLTLSAFDFVDRRDAMIDLGVACDGGKDSLSMAAAAGGETVMCPGNLVVSAYVGCPDITQVVTPDLKHPDAGALIHVDLAAGRRRLGGSALAQAYNQLGDASPDVTTASLKAMWEVTQGLISKGHIAAGHDISDGGIATTLCEMAFAGGCSALCAKYLSGLGPQASVHLSKHLHASAHARKHATLRRYLESLARLGWSLQPRHMACEALYAADSEPQGCPGRRRAGPRVNRARARSGIPNLWIPLDLSPSPATLLCLMFCLCTACTAHTLSINLAEPPGFHCQFTKTLPTHDVILHTGNCGITVDLPAAAHAADAKWGAFAPLYAEELGLVIEVAAGDAQKIAAEYTKAGLTANVIGKVGFQCDMSMGRSLVHASMGTWRGRSSLGDDKIPVPLI